MNTVEPAKASLNPVHLLIIAGVALGAALLMVFVVFGNQSLVDNAGDPYEYGKIAHGFIQDGYVKLTRRSASLYPEMIAVVYRLGGDNSTVVMLQCLMHVASCLLVYAIARRLFNVRTALIAGLACALHPMFLRYVPDLHMESMLIFASTLTILMAVRFHERPTWPNGVILGAVGMFAVLTKAVFLPFLVLFGAVIFFSQLRKGSMKGAVAVVAMAVTMALLLAPWTYRNYQVTGGRFVLLTPGSSDSFLRGYVFTRMEFATLQKPPYTDAENEVNAWFRDIAKENGVVWEEDEVVDEQNNARVAKHLIVTQPLDTIRKVFVGLFTFWYQMTSLKTSLVPAAAAIVGWALAIVGIRQARREGRPAWLLWMPILVMNVFVATLIPLGRYSIPILPFLAILAAFGVDTLLKRRAASQAGTA